MFLALMLSTAVVAPPGFASAAGVEYVATDNRHGVVLRAGNEVLYLGRDCDAAMANGERGRWWWSEKGFAAYFTMATVRFPGQRFDARLADRLRKCRSPGPRPVTAEALEGVWWYRCDEPHAVFAVGGEEWTWADSELPPARMSFDGDIVTVHMDYESNWRFHSGTRDRLVFESLDEPGRFHAYRTCD
jgi:hypothetical protein